VLMEITVFIQADAATSDDFEEMSEVIRDCVRRVAGVTGVETQSRHRRVPAEPVDWDLLDPSRFPSSES